MQGLIKKSCKAEAKETHLYEEKKKKKKKKDIILVFFVYSDNDQGWSKKQKEKKIRCKNMISKIW